MIKRRTIGSGQLLLALIASTASGAEVPASAGGDLPQGHQDFYPSAEHPVGWRGEGSGAWPGATPVKQWDAATGKNIVWKSPMPGPSFSQPIVIRGQGFHAGRPELAPLPQRNRRQGLHALFAVCVWGDGKRKASRPAFLVVK